LALRLQAVREPENNDKRGDSFLSPFFVSFGQQKEMKRGFSVTDEKNEMHQKKHWRQNEAAPDVQRCPNRYHHAHCCHKRLTTAAVNESP